jgi:hypothetical protein
MLFSFCHQKVFPGHRTVPHHAPYFLLVRSMQEFYGLPWPAIDMQKRWSLRSGPAEVAQREHQSHDSRCDSTEDVPHRVLRQVSPEKSTQVVGERAGLNYPDDDEDDSNNQKNNS